MANNFRLCVNAKRKPWGNPGLLFFHDFLVVLHLKQHNGTYYSIQ
ncbi:hypothetical protein HPS8415995_1868 [Glaesserella parasuis 84-15995]|nr:hypothetical protein HPS8415995_1868 [Glaesserella parasuis 84-15995]